MTTIEEKSLLAQVQLLKEIVDCDNMIIHTMVQAANGCTLPNPISSSSSPDEVAVKFTNKQYETLAIALSNLSSDSGLKNLNSWIDSKYISAKEEKARLLRLLS